MVLSRAWASGRGRLVRLWTWANGRGRLVLLRALQPRAEEHEGVGPVTPEAFLGASGPPRAALYLRLSDLRRRLRSRVAVRLERCLRLPLLPLLLWWRPVQLLRWLLLLLWLL